MLIHNLGGIVGMHTSQLAAAWGMTLEAYYNGEGSNVGTVNVWLLGNGTTHTTWLYTVESHSSPWKWVQLRGTWLKQKAVVEFNGKGDADNKGSAREHGCVEVYHNGEWSTASNCKWLLNDG